MIKQVTSTIASRVFVTLMNLLVMMLAGHALGAAGLGVISLVVLGITLVLLPANLIGGGALVYLVPRAPLWQLLRPAYAWAVISSVLSFALLRVFPLVPAGFEQHVCALAFIQAVYSVHLGVLLGQQRIGRHNLITAVHGATLLIVFAALLWRRPALEAMAYVYASYAAFGLTALLSALSLRRDVRPRTERVHVLRLLLRQGAFVQGANGLQLLSYRLSYWIIEHFHGRSALGLYSVGNQLAESAWIAPRSLGMVLLSRISNTSDAQQQRRLTLTTTKAAVACAMALLLVLLVLPDAVFGLAFGKDITGLRPILLLLAPGILCMSASQALSHYFSGKARTVHNLIGSGLGMLVTVGLGFWLVPRYGLKGAALTASAAYAASICYQILVFMRQTRSTPGDFLPNASDVERLRDLVRSALK